MVVFQELGDEGEIAQVFELVAGVASELLEGGAIGFFCKHDCTTSKIFLCEQLQRGNYCGNQAEKRRFYNSKTIVRRFVENSVEA